MQDLRCFADVQTTACALHVIHIKMFVVMSVPGPFIVVNFKNNFWADNYYSKCCNEAMNYAGYMLQQIYSGRRETCGDMRQCVCSLTLQHAMMSSAAAAAAAAEFVTYGHLADNTPSSGATASWCRIHCLFCPAVTCVVCPSV